MLIEENSVLFFILTRKHDQDSDIPPPYELAGLSCARSQRLLSRDLVLQVFLVIPSLILVALLHLQLSYERTEHILTFIAAEE